MTDLFLRMTHFFKAFPWNKKEDRGDKQTENPKKKKVPVIFLYFGLPGNLSVSLEVCLSVEFFLL